MRRSPARTARLSLSALYGAFGLLLFAPSLAQAGALYVHHYGLGLALRVGVHVVLPVIFVSLVWRQSWWQAFIEPLLPRDRAALTWSIKAGLAWGLGGAAVIVGAFGLLYAYIDFPKILDNLLQDFQVRKDVYVLVALAIAIVNPFLEEYFWRGFIFRWFNKLSTNSVTQNFFLGFTGLFFSLHHVLIIYHWFNWWQFLLSTIFLAGAGILFNWMYRRSGSIIASWITHTLADITIVMIGFYLFGFFS